MPLITETYYLSLTQDNRGILRLRCSQDDTLRTVNLKLYNNGSIFTIPSGISAYVSGVKQNGAVFSKSCTISQDRKSVVLQLSSNITNVDGIIVAEIVLNDGNGDRIGTSNFIIQVEKNPIRVGVIQDTETPIEYVNDFITQIQALTARVNNLITPNGDPSLAEVVDARISSLDNNTYQNLKARIDADIAALNTRKANKSEVYTKAQVDTLLDNVEIDVDDELSDKSENPVQNKVINRAIGEIKADLDNKVGVIGIVKGHYIDLTTDQVSLTPQESSAGTACSIIDCTTGDKFVINALGATRGRAWGFLDSNNHVLSMADANATVTDLELTAPENAVKLIINDKGGGMSYKVGNNLATKADNILSDDIKSALLTCFEHVAWADEDGQSYYNALEKKLYERRYITAVFNPGAHTVYTDDKLDSLKQYLVVTYFKSSESNGTVIASAKYSLSGSLNAGANTVTVTYKGLTTTFNVAANDFTQRIVFVDRAQFTNHSGVTPEIFLEFPNKYYQSFAAADSPLPKFKFGPASTSSGTLTQDSLYSAIKVPKGKTKVNVTCSSAHKCNIICYNLNSDGTYYRNIAYSSGWLTDNTSFTFDVSNYQYFVVNIYSSDTTAANYTISFE